jgi:uncharacterized protein (TIGR04141 family)
VTGKPRQESLGKRLTGADSLVLTAKVSLEGLAGKAQELLLFYGAKTYQDRFGWIDNVRRAPHEDLETLDRWLEESIRAGTADVAYLAPPSTLDWAHVDGFRYPGQKGDQPLEPDLDIDRCLEKWHGEPTIQILKRKKIEVYSNGATDEPNDAWSIYHALVFQGSRDGRLFLLVDGQWFEVAKSFAEEVSQRLGAIPRSPLALGPCPSNLGEGEYNAAVAKDSGGQLALMDKKLVKVAGGGDPIELCDLFSASGQFIHVKKRHASSTLSHLFAQGRIAGQSFLRDGDLREKARTHLKDAGPAYQDLIPLAGPVPASDFEVVFAIITKNADGLPGNLPFFSRLNLVNAAESLVADFGYRVSFAGIELAAPVDNKK